MKNWGPTPRDFPIGWTDDKGGGVYRLKKERIRLFLVLPWALLHKIILSRIVNWEPIVREILNDLKANIPAGDIASALHDTLAAIVLEGAHLSEIPCVVLTGGCFQNRVLMEKAVALLDS